MGVSRLDTGSDGKSDSEAFNAEALRDLKVIGTMSFRVQERPSGFFMDFHPAPFRRWHVGLGGRTLIGLSDGTAHTCVPGDVRLIADTTGQGHTPTYPDGLAITMHITPMTGSRCRGDIYEVQQHRDPPCGGVSLVGSPCGSGGW